MSKIALALLAVLSGCAAAPAPSCPAVDEEQLATRIADAVYERLRREGHLRTVGDEAPDEGAATQSPESETSGDE